MAEGKKEAESKEARSGRYPGVSLKDAVEAAGKLYSKEKQVPVNNETAVVHMGFKGMSGPARVMIGALRQYGLIERVGAGRFKLSKLAIQVLHGNAEQKAEALRKAALHPRLFHELGRTHLDGSEENLRSHLITQKGFIDTGARNAARAFRETMKFANVTDSGYDSSRDAEGTENNGSADGDWPMDQQSQAVKQDQPQTVGLPPLSWVLSIPRGVRAELRISGKDVRREDLQRLKQQIDFLVESFDDGAAE